MTGTPQNGELWKVVRELADGKKVTPAVRDKLIFASMHDLRDRFEKMEKRLNKIWPIYQGLAIFGGVAMSVFTAVVLMFVSGRLSIVRVP